MQRPLIYFCFKDKDFSLLPYSFSVLESKHVLESLLSVVPICRAKFCGETFDKGTLCGCYSAKLLISMLFALTPLSTAISL